MSPDIGPLIFVPKTIHDRSVERKIRLFHHLYSFKHHASDRAPEFKKSDKKFNFFSQQFPEHQHCLFLFCFCFYLNFSAHCGHTRTRKPVNSTMQKSVTSANWRTPEVSHSKPVNWRTREITASRAKASNRGGSDLSLRHERDKREQAPEVAGLWLWDRLPCPASGRA